MKILIYGAGALGQALGCMLAAANHQVDLILRPKFQTAILQNGLSVKGVLGNFSAPGDMIGCYSSIVQTTDCYDYILLTTKSYDTAASLEDIRTNGPDFNYIVSLQNGCGNLEQLEEVFGAERCFGGRVITGFEIKTPGNVTVTVTADAIHLGTGHEGDIPLHVTELTEAIDQAGHPCLAVPDINVSLYAKLLYNCSLNPLGAILGTHYGPLGDNPETRRIMDLVMEETFAVITKRGGTTPWPDAAAYREVFYQKLLPATYDHRPSMLQDLEQSKPTEVEALVGWVEQEARQLNLEVPTCSMLATLVRFRENQAAG